MRRWSFSSRKARSYTGCPPASRGAQRERSCRIHAVAGRRHRISRANRVGNREAHRTTVACLGYALAFDDTAGLAIEERSELIARCVATAGWDEIEPAVVMRKHPRLYPFTLR
jgi:hypothetical protein